MDYYKGITSEGKTVIGTYVVSGKNHYIVKSDEPFSDEKQGLEFYSVACESIKKCTSIGVTLPKNDSAEEYTRYTNDVLSCYTRMQEENPEGLNRYIIQKLQRAGILNEKGNLAYPYSLSVDDKRVTKIKKL